MLSKMGYICFKNPCLKLNGIVQQDFELAYVEAAVQHLNYDSTLYCTKEIRLCVCKKRAIHLFIGISLKIKKKHIVLFIF